MPDVQDRGCAGGIDAGARKVGPATVVDHVAHLARRPIHDHARARVCGVAHLVAAVSGVVAAVGPLPIVKDGPVVPPSVGPASDHHHFVVNEQLPRFWVLGRPFGLPNAIGLRPWTRHVTRAIESHNRVISGSDGIRLLQCAVKILDGDCFVEAVRSRGQQAL